MLPDLHIGFSRGRSGGLVFPSLSEFSTVCCDPQSQRLWHSQQSRNRCFCGTLLLFQRSSGCWQFRWRFYFFLFFLQMDVQLFLHHLLKRHFSIDLLLHPCQKSVSCMYFCTFSTVSLIYVSTLSQYHTESILETTLSFELRQWFLPLHSFSKLFLDTLGPLPFHINFRIMCISTKCFAERVQYELH